MKINRIEAGCQGYASSGDPGSRSRSVNAFDSFQSELSNWERRIEDTFEKEKEYDSSGNIQMSEKQWRNLMQKVDGAIATLENDLKEMTQEDTKRLEQKNPVSDSDPKSPCKDSLDILMSRLLTF